MLCYSGSISYYCFAFLHVLLLPHTCGVVSDAPTKQQNISSTIAPHSHTLLTTYFHLFCNNSGTNTVEQENIDHTSVDMVPVAPRFRFRALLWPIWGLCRRLDLHQILQLV